MSAGISPDLRAQISSSGIRVSNIWCLAALSDSPPDTFREFFEDDGPWPAELAWANELFEDKNVHEEDKWEEFMCRCCEKGLHGFVIAAECQVYRALSPTSVSCSWGRYRTKVFYAQSVEAALRKAAAWGESEFKAALANFAEGRP